MANIQNIRYDRRPAIAIVADLPETHAAMKAMASQLGARPIAAFAVADAARALEEAQIPIDAVLVDISGPDDGSLQGLFDRLQDAACARRHASVIRLPGTLIDLAAARASHPDIALLVDDDERACRDALGDALDRMASVDPRLRERERQPMRLAQLSEEVGRIARTLAALSAQDDRHLADMHDTAPAEAPTAATVRAAIRARRLREQYFEAELFADPAWDMLLDLMAARLERRHVAVSSLCIAASVPPTTALRWMKQLTDDGLFVRVADPRDGRRVFIELSDEAAAGLSAYFQALGRMGIAMP